MNAVDVETKLQSYNVTSIMTDMYTIFVLVHLDSDVVQRIANLLH